MKRAVCILSIIFLFALFAGCRESSDDDQTSIGSLIGAKNTYTIEGISFSEISATGSPLNSSITFPTGIDDSTTSIISKPFAIAETETTYKLWKAVYDWATTDSGSGKRADGGPLYTFANAGQLGSNSSEEANTAGGDNQPVGKIKWRDAMIWCNALTEYYNANNGSADDLNFVYCTDTAYSTPIRISTNSETITTSEGTEDNPCVNPDAKGFRLPLNAEYEFAARYLGTTDEGITSAIFMSGYYWTPGNYASGASGDYTNTATTDVAVFGVWYDDIHTDATSTGVTTTASVGSKTANRLGIYDMSGNVMEWCFDWETIDSSRVIRGGCFSLSNTYLQAGFLWGPTTDIIYSFFGFRFARTLQN